MRKPVLAIVCFVVAATTLGASAGKADEAAGKKKELQRVKREMREKKKELKRADRKERSILSDLDRIDRDIQAGKSDLAEQQKQLAEAEAALQDVEKRSSDVNSRLSVLKKQYAERVRAFYKMSRNGSGNVILASGTLSDSFARVKYVSTVLERDRLLMQEYGRSLDSLAALQEESTRKKAAASDRKRSVEAKRTDLEARKRKKGTLLTSVRQEKGLYEQTLRELEESSVSLWALVKKEEQEKKAAKAAAARPAAPVPPARAAASDKNRLPWPLEGKVITRFGMQRHPQFGTMVFRRGIEIEAHEGEPVRAVSDGLVAYADWYKGYGKLVIVEHAPGFYTLYGNLSRLELAKGDRVVKGQEIGLAGDTGSLKGSKLYFEIRRNGEAQDPLVWLAKR